MQRFSEEELCTLAKVVARSLSMPEVMELIFTQVSQEFEIEQAKGAAICMAAYAWYHTGDDSLKDFLKDWIEDQS